MIISDYIFAIQIHKNQGFRKKLFLLISLIYSSSFLLYFKYSNFFIENSNYFFGTHFQKGNLFLPIGISFYTFQSISYLLDVYRKEIPPAENFSDYTFYMTFFPHLVAGPIVRAKDFLPQIKHPQIINGALYKESIMRISIGLIKKLFLADYLAKYIDLVHSTPDGFSGGEHLISMYAYSFQIYFDFSGYSDIAIGIALILGYRLKENFDNPYGAQNITTFWRKWHISLSLWLRDYIYIPMGGNRLGWGRTQLNVLSGMLISGLWHGANWTFVVWGLLHGLGVVVQNTAKRLGMPAWPRWSAQMLTFVFVSLAWVFFRADSVPHALHMLQGLWHSPAGFWLPEQLPWWGLLGIAALVWGLSPRALWWQRQSVAWLARLGPWLGGVLLALMLCVVLYGAPEGVPDFIYFRF
jgi:D-alanyl-lipoteichoic acid acyltransferase DltB (MBOAT superfamily)